MTDLRKLARIVQSLSDTERRRLAELMTDFSSENDFEMDVTHVKVSGGSLNPNYTEICPILQRHSGDGRVRINSQNHTVARVTCEYRVDMDCRIGRCHCSYVFG